MYWTRGGHLLERYKLGLHTHNKKFEINLISVQKY